MSAASAAVEVASVDWNIVAAAAATFIATGIATVWGLVKGKKKVQEGKSEITSIVGASIVENVTMNKLSERLQENTNALRDNTAALNRNTDVLIMSGKRD